jgi:N-acetylgalactosamine-N,N'-diacetylbacillosaminyl-diphospho-undecaprenol 4-alpha-N-acetylgalactosaminyltransferase
MQKKLSILINDLDSGGAERVVSILLDMLKTKYDITLFVLHNIIFYDIPKDIKIVVVGNSKLSDSGLIKLLKLPYLAWRYKKLNIDSHISLSFLSRSNYINILAKLFGIKSKIIVGERAMPSLQYNQGFQGKINKFLIKILYPKADLVFANSKGNALDLEKNFNIKDIKVINNLFDINQIIKLSKEKVKLKDGFNFITIGRVDEGKNHQLLINAIANINANLYIIGDGILINKLNQQIKDLSLTNKVFLLGKQKNPYKYLSKADCFVFASTREGFPNVLVEALACKLALISTDCQSGPREILAPDTDISFQLYNRIELANFGILTPVNRLESTIEAMNLIKNSTKLLNSYKNRAIQRAMEFDKDRIINDFINIIEQ